MRRGFRPRVRMRESAAALMRRPHRQNDVLRLLTVISVVILPLTLVTGLFGMNVVFPGEGTHEAFWVIVVGLLVISAATLGFFRWRRWL